MAEQPRSVRPSYPRFFEERSLERTSIPRGPDRGPGRGRSPERGRAREREGTATASFVFPSAATITGAITSTATPKATFTAGFERPFFDLAGRDSGYPYRSVGMGLRSSWYRAGLS
jgi:hypothetical protein